jgi:hypothetical protein
VPKSIFLEETTIGQCEHTFYLRASATNTLHRNRLQTHRGKDAIFIRSRSKLLGRSPKAPFLPISPALSTLVDENGSEEICSMQSSETSCQTMLRPTGPSFEFDPVKLDRAPQLGIRTRPWDCRRIIMNS